MNHPMTSWTRPLAVALIPAGLGETRAAAQTPTVEVCGAAYLLAFGLNHLCAPRFETIKKLE